MNNFQRLHRNFYNKYTKRWSEFHANSFWHEAQFRKLVKYFKKNDRIIDIGCANGIHVPLFLGIGRYLRYQGIDISSGMLEIARRHYPQLSFHEADILDQKMLPKKHYAGFWASAIFMHVPESDWPKLIANIELLVKPSGVGYLTLPQQRPNPESVQDRRYFSYWTQKKAKSVFKTYNWKVLATGDMPERKAKWFWMIIRLPKQKRK